MLKKNYYFEQSQINNPLCKRLWRDREESSREKIKIVLGKRRRNTVNVDTTFALKFQQKVEFLIKNTSFAIK